MESPSATWVRLSGGTLSTATSDGTSLPTTVRGQIAAVLQRDRDFGRVINDMGVCNDVAVFCIKDDAGACALELALAGAHVGDVEEPAEEGVLEQRVLRRALADGAARGDVHDGRRDALDHGRERRHRGFADRRRQGGLACNRERSQCVR